ncbi:MAG: glycosyltransferase [Candidatus Cloacimonetes bacterium]|nr:glycosyltransferase [Candidatus Cloacimonadota bacterium]
MNNRYSTDLPLISVIVPVYNVEPYLPTCIESILNQTYDNLDIILIAATSSDNSVAICDLYGKNDDRINVIHREAKGLSDARNVGIENAEGEYLSFIDSDDFISLDFIETLYLICKKYNCDIAQCNVMKIAFDINDPILEENPESLKTFSGIDMCYNFYNELSLSTVVTWSKLYRKKLFEIIRFPVGKLHEDVATTHQLFYLSHKVGVTNKKLYYYRQVETSIMGQPYTLKRLDGLQFYEERWRFFQERHEDKLSALTLYRYATSIPYHLQQIKKYVPNSQIIQKSLKLKCRSAYIMIIKNKNISIKYKMLATLICNFPNLTKMLVLIKHLTLGKQI